MDNNFGFEQIDSGYLDVLKEIGNIGAGNATTALAKSGYEGAPGNSFGVP